MSKTATQRPPQKTIMLAKLLHKAGDKGMSRKEMVDALLRANGREVTFKARRGYGSVGFFTIGTGVGGVYWNNAHDDGRYRITELGTRLVKTGTLATKEEREAVIKAHREKMRALRQTREKDEVSQGFARMATAPRPSIMVDIRGVMVPLAEVQAAISKAVNSQN